VFETEAIRQNYELGVMAGEAKERERILKLLEASAEISKDALEENFETAHTDYKTRTYGYLAGLDKAVALIKGEK